MNAKKNFEQLYQTILENAELPPNPPPQAAPAAEPQAAAPAPVSPDDPVIQKALSIILAYGAGKVTNTEAANQIQALLTTPSEPEAAAPAAAEGAPPAGQTAPVAAPAPKG